MLLDKNSIPQTNPIAIKNQFSLFSNQKTDSTSPLLKK
jgi:hypothetical protein